MSSAGKSAVPAFQHVRYLWDDSAAAKLSPAELLVYRSNLLGADLRITNTGGGNTSAKVAERDPLTGREVDVLWVKGSGGDLRTSTLANFASLDQQKLLALQPLYAAAEPRGPKSAAEDRMVGLFPHCAFNLNPRAASIDTPLHSFLPAKHVDHMHPNAVIAIAAARRSRELTAEIFGQEVAWTPWLRPGFELGLELQRIAASRPMIRGVVLGQHGLINWADSSKECYDLTLSLIEKAARHIEARDKGAQTFGGAMYASLEPAKQNEVLLEILPWLRGQISQAQRFIGTVQADEVVLRFVNSRDAARLAGLGTSCPDHFLRTKIKPLYVDWNPQTETVDALKEKLTAGLAQYRKDYAAYYQSCKRADSPAMRDPNPTVILIPGVGMIAWGKDKSESRVTAEFYNCAVEVMRGAETVNTSRSRSRKPSTSSTGCWKRPNCAACPPRENWRGASS
jgi:rhamnulose-1-phosphate aldolase/alcohol dehydrogenase